MLVDKRNKLIGLKAIDEIPAMLAYWDNHEICRFANPAYLKRFGQKQEDMLHKMSLKELLGPNYEKTLPYIKGVLSGTDQSFDREVVRPDGSVRYSHASYTPDFNEDGVVEGFIAHIVDITPRKRLEQSYARSEKRLKDILESTPDAIVMVDHTGAIQLVNQQTETLFGYRKTEMLGKSIDLLIPDTFKGVHQKHMDAYFQSATTRPMGQGLALFGKRKNGDEFRVEVSLSPSVSEEGTFVLAAVRDISERVRVEQELEESNRRNSIFVQQAPNAIAMFDKEMRYISTSQKWIEDYQLEGREIIGRSHYEIFPEIGDDWKKIHRECLAGKINQCDEASFVRADGKKQWITWDVRPWYVSKDEIGGLLMYTADLTLQKEREHEQRRIEEILDKTSEVARIGTWEVDLQEQTVRWSRVTREIHELEDGPIPDLQNAINYIKEGDSRDRLVKAFSEAQENGTPYDLEVEIVTAKGNTKWTRAIGQPKFENGLCTGLYGVFQDIDPIKASEIRLNQANEELKAIFNSGPISIIGTDRQGLITHFNRGAEEMLQYSAEEMIGIHTPAIIHKEEEVAQRGKELEEELGVKVSGFDIFVEYAKRGHDDSREWTYIRKDGTRISVLLVITALRNLQGEIFGFLGMATDITESIENQNRLREVNENLEVLTEKLTTQNIQLANFVHITSHNLRAPVSNLNSLLHFYSTSESEEEKEMLFEKFERVIKHLSETLNTLVEALKIRDRREYKMETISFADVLTKTREMIAGQIMETDAQVISDFDKAPEIEYNLEYLESIFLNLMTNAIKYRARDRSPVITLETHQIEGQTVLTVEDNGLGIDLNRHGQKLFGLHKTFHRHEEAKGIGLFLTKNQVEALGGTIAAESEVNKGTKFTIKF